MIGREYCFRNSVGVIPWRAVNAQVKPETRRIHPQVGVPQGEGLAGFFPEVFEQSAQRNAEVLAPLRQGAETAGCPLTMSTKYGDITLDSHRRIPRPSRTCRR